LSFLGYNGIGDKKPGLRIISLIDNNFKFLPLQMIKWFAYIVIGLILIPCISTAKTHDGGGDSSIYIKPVVFKDSVFFTVADTTPKSKKQQENDKKKIKEVNRAKPLPKPEKVDEGDARKKSKRQRRPPGMERPPEIPRRNGT
jgi:hypothetical protein